MPNERDIPIFSRGPEAPIGKVNGVPLATKKQSGMLMKRIMANMKSKAKVTAKVKGHKSHVGTPGKRGIEADNKVRFGSYPKFY